ncbi:hypothetical protein [Halobaculum sp. EA56]|uniref:hypothetical protein n=1 Tax=Halobaculum sp. EA56 TaxID=3421648 RepID=UPI003EB6A1DB
MIPGGAVGGAETSTTDAASSVTGEVTYADGSAASGWKVLAGTDGDFVTTRTNASGAFALNTSEDAVYDVWYHNTTRRSVRRNNFPRDGRPDVFALGEVNTSAGEDVGAIQVPNASLLHVQVLDESGTPVSNAHVRFYHVRNGARAPIEASTDGDGYAVLDANDVRGIELTSSPR